MPIGPRTEFPQQGLRRPVQLKLKVLGKFPANDAGMCVQSKTYQSSTKPICPTPSVPSAYEKDGP